MYLVQRSLSFTANFTVQLADIMMNNSIEPRSEWRPVAHL